MTRPFLALALALAAGAVAGGGASPLAASIVLALGGLLLLAAWHAPDRAALPALLGAAAALGAAGAGIERSGYDGAPLRRWVVEQDPQDPVQLSGIAAADARELADRWVLLVDVESVSDSGGSQRRRGRARIDVGGQAARLEVLQGDRVTVWVQLRLPRRSGTPGAFDVEAQARRQGIHVFGYCKSPQLVARERPAGLSTARARAWARAALRRYVPPGPEEGLVRAMVLGDRTGVDTETAEAFRIAGTYHVLAISGAQVALVAGLLVALLRRLRVSPLVSALAVSAAIAWYAELVGGDVPVVRAAVMAIVMAGGRVLDLDADMANLLGLAGAGLLLYHPSAVTDVGFQLSFVATLGILLLTRPLLTRLPRLPLRLELALAASLAAQAPLTPLLIAHFHRLCPAALLLNLAAVPLSAAVLLLGMAVLPAAATWPWIAQRVGEVAWMAAHGLLVSGRASLISPLLDVRPCDPLLMAVAVYLAGLVAVVRGRPRAGAIWAALGLLAMLFGSGPPPADGRLHLTALDVGQGDSLVVRSPAGRIWLVDTGGSPSGPSQVGEMVLGPYLWSLGARRVQAVVLTHAHPDHVGGAPFLVRAFAVGEVWEGPAPVADPVYRELSESLAEARLCRRTVVTGLRTDWDGVTAEVLGPRPPGRPPWKTRNDDSVVLRLRYGTVRFLLTGDVEGRGEGALGPVSAEVVKVPHHGSRSSSSSRFVAATSPRVAVVSVGFRNRFGHPNGEVVNRYLAAGARVFRTDRDGAVTVSTDGERIWVESARDGLETRIR